MLELLCKALDEPLLLRQARLEAGHDTVSDRAGGEVRRRRTAAGAEKIELSTLLTQHICLLTQHSRLVTVRRLRRQQAGHEVRAYRVDIRRRLRWAQLSRKPNHRGGRRRSSRRISRRLEKSVTATVMTTAQPAVGGGSIGRNWTKGRRHVVAKCMRSRLNRGITTPARAGVGAGGTGHRAANGRRH